MAKVLKLDRKFYGDDGLLSLYRGDDWQISGTVVERINGYETILDLSPYTAQSFFASATGGSDIPASAATGAGGLVTISIPAASTPLVSLSSGSGAYIILQDVQGKMQTIPTSDDSIAVLDRGFPNG